MTDTDHAYRRGCLDALKEFAAFWPHSPFTPREDFARWLAVLEWGLSHAPNDKHYLETIRAEVQARERIAQASDV